jgi:hypothetical protein
VQRFKITCACKKIQTTQGTGTGGTRVVISQPEAIATTTQTINPYGPAHPCRSLACLLGTGHLQGQMLLRTWTGGQPSLTSSTHTLLPMMSSGSRRSSGESCPHPKRRRRGSRLAVSPNLLKPKSGCECPHYYGVCSNCGTMQP